MKERCNIVICGVGGQGVIFAAKTIGQALMDKGEDVIQAEVHGMAQRGGIVVCTLVVGSKYNPLIKDGDADIILSFEPAEALRAVNFASEKTHIITNTSPIIPFTVSVGKQKYPPVDEMLNRIKDFTPNLVTLDAIEIAKESNARDNVVMLGAFAKCECSPLTLDDIKSYIKSSTPEKFHEANMRGLDAGYNAV